VSKIQRRLAALAAFPLVTAAMVTMGAPAQASGGGGVEATGSCAGAGSTTWDLKAKHDDGQIEVEFEIDSNIPGQVWRVKITDNGDQVFKGKRTTAGASGSFTVQRRVPDQAGSDKFVGKATNPVTGEKCVGKVTL
jgi:hypothetical protein